MEKIESLLSFLSYRQRGVVSLIGGFMIHLILGTFYLWSTLNVYVSSYLRNDNQNYTTAQVNGVFPFMMLAINICNPIGVPLAKYIGFRFLSILCSFALSLSIILSSYFIQQFYIFAIFYGFIFGLASGLVYMVPFNTSYIYYHNHKAIVSGIISLGFGFGATLFLWILFYKVNPHNQLPIQGYYSKEVTDNLPHALRILGTLYFILSLIGALLIERPTEIEMMIVEQEQQNKLQNDHDNLQNDPSVNPNGFIELTTRNLQEQKYEQIQFPNECQSLRDGLKTKVLYQTIAMATLFCCFGLMLIGNFKSYAQQYNYSDSELTIIATIGSIVNGLSRLFWGSLLHTVSINTIIKYNLIIQLIISSTLAYVVNIGALYGLYVVLGYFSYGGWFAILPTLVVNIFGNKIGTSIYGITFTGFTLAGWIQFFIVKDLQQLIGWNYLFLIFTLIQLSSLIYFFNIKYEVNWQQFYKNQQSNRLLL